MKSNFMKTYSIKTKSVFHSSAPLIVKLNKLDKGKKDEYRGLYRLEELLCNRNSKHTKSTNN